MPGIRVTGKSGGSSSGPRGKAPGPSVFQDALLSGMASGTDPFGSMSPEQQQALAGSPSFQNGSWHSAAQGEMSRLLAKAVRDLRSGASDRQQSLQTALQAAALLGAQGALSPELQSGVGALRSTPGFGGAMVPYQPPRVPALQLSARYQRMSSYVPPIPSGPVIEAQSPPRSIATQGGRSAVPIDRQAVDLLRSIDASNRSSVGLEQQQLQMFRGGNRPNGGWGSTFTASPGSWQWSGGGGAAGAGGSGGGGSWMPPPPGGWGPTTGPGWGAVPPFLRRQRNAPGGGGGGGGGGGRGGAGGGGRFHIPFAARFGFGNSAAFIGGGWGLAAQAAEELFFAPQSIGNAESSALASSAPAYDMLMGTAALGRAGGFSGPSLNNTINPRDYAAPLWQQRLGIGPEESLRMVQNFGIVPRGSDDAAQLSQSIGEMRMAPALSGMSESQLEGSVGQAARLGLVSPDAHGVQTWSAQVQDAMARAVEAGMDRASILHSIDASVAMAAQGGGLGNSASSADRFLSNFATLPGGRTGEAGLEAQQGALAFNRSIGNDPVATIAANSVVRNFHSAADVQKYLDRVDPGYYEKYIANSPSGHQAMRQMLTANNGGDHYSAGRIWADLSKSSAGANMDLAVNSPVNQNFGNTPLRDVVDSNNAQLPVTGTIAFHQAQTSQRMYDEAIKLGRSPAAAAAISGAAIGDSGGNPANGGYFQWRMDRRLLAMKFFGKPAEELTPEQSVDIANWELKTQKRFAGTNATLDGLGNSSAEAERGSDAMVNGFLVPWDPAKNETVNSPDPVADRARSASAARAQFGRRVRADNMPTTPENDPSRERAARTNALHGAMTGSDVSMHEMTFVITPVNQGLNNVVHAARAFADSVEKANASMAQTTANSPAMQGMVGLN